MAGQKTGFFLDQRDNRLLVGRLCARKAAGGQGPRALNVFGYTGGSVGGLQGLGGEGEQMAS